jgi:esterase/lipase superfamily enzyme
MVAVYFATNRTVDPTQPNGFGDGIVANDAAAITFATADVTVDLSGEGSGTINAITQQNAGGFSDAAVAAIAAAGKNLLIFIHGYASSFTDAITRAALNAEWYRQEIGGGTNADSVALAFVWPSLGRPIDIGVPDADYKHDQAMAAASGFHLGQFLLEIERVRTACLAANPNRRTYLLAHSMGNYVLAEGTTWWYHGHQPPDDMFDQAILAASDVEFDAFVEPNGGGLSRLKDVARFINIYYSRRDAVLWLSSAVNGNSRLGHNGPDNMSDAALFPSTLFRMVDCSDYADFFPPVLSPETRAYYRVSPTVRGDIARLLAVD